MHPLHLSHAADARDGGIATSVKELITAQNSVGLTPTWITADRFPASSRCRLLTRDILTAHPDVVHIHGLWRSPTRITARLVDRGILLIIAPHGMLDPGALVISPRKKQLVWHFWEQRSLATAKCMHALCPPEAIAIQAMLPNTPIAVISNGVTLPSEKRAEASLPSHSDLPSRLWANTVPLGDRVLLFLGRFHHKKGLDPLLRAWQAVAEDARKSGWWLALVGYGDNGVLENQVRSAHRRRQLEHVFVLGPCFGDQKAAAFHHASAFVLPSFSEGLPMAALEAMAYRLPCWLSHACNLSEAFEVGAAHPAEPDPPTLARALKHLFTLSPADLEAMGVAGHTLVAERYSWQRVAQQTRLLYEWVRGGGERPWFVRSG